MRSGEPARSLPWRRIEQWLISMIAAHSVAVGAMLLAAPAWSVRFAGRGAAEPLFFFRQAEVFHLVGATGYVLEERCSRTVTLVVVTKAMACTLLLASALLIDTAWLVLFSRLTDGAMGAAVWLAHRQVARGEGGEGAK